MVGVGEWSFGSMYRCVLCLETWTCVYSIAGVVGHWGHWGQVLLITDLGIDGTMR
jgi:hypothetical protein